MSEAPAGDQWHVTDFAPPSTPHPIATFKVVPPYTIYSPDLVFMVLGTGASTRLADYLNGVAKRETDLRQQVAQLREALESIVDSADLHSHEAPSCECGAIDQVAAIAASALKDES
jgi:hypothetical protein